MFLPELRTLTRLEFGRYAIGAGVLLWGMDPNFDLPWFFYLNERYGCVAEGAD